MQFLSFAFGTYPAQKKITVEETVQQMGSVLSKRLIMKSTNTRSMTRCFIKKGKVMKRFITLITLFTLILMVQGASALSITDSELGSLSWSYTSDPSTDTAGTDSYKTYGMGHAIANGFLYVVVQTNFPEAGATGNDSYTSMTHFSPGDLYLNVGGTFQTNTGNPFGIATTSHANVVTQAYPGEVWTNVTAGRLYSNAVFATGTYEQYQENHPTFAPDDGDGNNKLNSYPTLIKSGNQVAGDISGVRYRANGASDPWDWDIFYKVSLSALGLNPLGGDNLQAFWVMECGNDGAQDVFRTPVVPEPSTIALVTAGITALAVRRRRTA
jgi:hypothetical protein